MLREQIIRMKPELEVQLSLESVAICALLHDVCKIDIYKEGILSSKNEDGFWETAKGGCGLSNHILPFTESIIYPPRVNPTTNCSPTP